MCVCISVHEKGRKDAKEDLSSGTQRLEACKPEIHNLVTENLDKAYIQSCSYLSTYFEAAGKKA